MRTFKAFLFLLLAPALFAQRLTFGDAIPLTNTRYGIASADDAIFRSNGRDTFAFWRNGTTLRVTKLVDGERRVGRPILTGVGQRFDAVWNGSYFLVVSANNDVQGQLLDGNGERVGGAFVVSDGDAARLARTGGRTFLLSARQQQITVAELSATGTIVGSERDIATDLTLVDAAATANGLGILAASSTRGLVLLLADTDGRVVAERSITPPGIVVPKLATNGRDYAVAWVGDMSRNAFATFVSADGEIGRTVFLAENVATASLAALWSGDDYVIGFVQQNGSASAVHVDPSTETVTTSEVFDIGPARKVLGGWSDGERNQLAFDTVRAGMEAVELGSENAAVPIGYTAASQMHRASAVGNEAALVIWTEFIDGETSIHGGVRHHDGRWFERPLAVPLSGSEFLLAAGDNKEFMLVVVDHSAERVTAYRIDEDVRVAAVGSITGITPKALLWNGSSYVIAGFAGNRLATALLSRGGTLSSIVALPALPVENTMTVNLATDGSGYLLTWNTDIVNYFPPGGEVHAVYVAALDADRNVSYTERAWEYENQVPPQPFVAWNGSEYDLAFHDGRRLHFGTVAANGAVQSLRPRLESLTFVESRDLRVFRRDGRPTVSWIEINDVSGRVSLEVWQPFSTPESLVADSLAHTLPFPDGRLAMVSAETQDAAPHHGIQRVVLRIADRTMPPAPPAAPGATVLRINGRIQLDWTAVDEPVHGYRIEYRIGDGSWNEIERWNDADELSVRWIAGRAGVTYALRVRAFNDAGPGAYSQPAVIYVGKRRSIR